MVKKLSVTKIDRLNPPRRNRLSVSPPVHDTVGDDAGATPESGRGRCPGRQAVPRDLDNYAIHKHPKMRAWLARHPRCVFHFTPHPAPGPMPSKAFLPPSPDADRNAESSTRSSTCRPRSTAISANTTASPNLWFGPPTPIASSRSQSRIPSVGVRSRDDSDPYRVLLRD